MENKLIPGAALVGVEPALLLVDEAVVPVCPVSEPVALVLGVAEDAFCDSEEAVLLLPEVEDRWVVMFAASILSGISTEVNQQIYK